MLMRDDSFLSNFKNVLIYEKFSDFCAINLSTKLKKNLKAMSILSLTFHTPTDLVASWDEYIKTDLENMVENLMDVEKYILSEVESDMISEGKNTNLLLIFDDIEKRQEFIDIEFKNITERIEAKFGQEVMIFETFLNQKKNRF